MKRSLGQRFAEARRLYNEQPSQVGRHMLEVGVKVVLFMAGLGLLIAVVAWVVELFL